MGARDLLFTAPVKTDPGAHSASCTMGTGSLLGEESGRDVALVTHSRVVPNLHMDKAIPPPLLYALNGMVMGCLYLYLYIRPVLPYLFIPRFYCLDICCRIDVSFLYRVLGSLGVCDCD